MTEQQRLIIQLAARFLVAEIQKNGIGSAYWPVRTAIECAEVIVAKAMEHEQ